MKALPILRRELRLTVRRPQTYWVRGGAASMAGLATLVVLSPAFGAGRNQAVIGAQLVHLLAWAAFLYCMIAGCVLAADGISQERREGTLDLLKLAGMRGRDVVLGKFAAVFLNPFYAVAAALPFLVLPVIFGGVTWGDYLRVCLVLPVTLMYSASIGLWVSSRSRVGRRALAAAVMVMIVFMVLPLMFAAWPGTGAGLHGFSTLSPLNALRLAAERSYIVYPALYWVSLLCPFLLSVLYLALASHRLNAERDSSEEFLTGSTAPPRHARSGNNPFQDARFNPILWQEASGPGKTWLTWIGLVCLSIGFLFILAGGVGLRTSLEVLCGVSGGMHLAFKVWLAMEASRCFGEARRHGELELLYVTPLSKQLLWQGHLSVLRRRFLGPGLLLLGLDMMVILFGLNSVRAGGGSPDFWALAYMVGTVMFVLDSLALGWLGLWEGLVSRNTVSAFVRALGKVLILPWLAFAVCALMIGPLVGLQDSLMAMWLFVGSIIVMAFWRWASDQLQNKFQAGLEMGMSHRPDSLI